MDLVCEIDVDSLTCIRCGRRCYTANVYRMCSVPKVNARGASERKNISSSVADYASFGPGTQLKSLLAGWPFHIVSSPDCKCNQRARYMDAKGCDWCESDEGMAEIMGFLRESAEERGLPFVDMAARLLVRRAIHNARKAEARRAKEAEQAAGEGKAS